MAKRSGNKKLNAGVQTDPDLKDVARRAKGAGKDVEKKLKQVNRDAAWIIVNEARKNARDLGGVHEKAAGAIKPMTRRSAIGIAAAAKARHPYALVAFLGAKRRTGWYGWRRYDKGGIREGLASHSRSRRGLRTDTTIAWDDGTTSRTGTFRSGSGSVQHPEWIGNQWEPGAGHFGQEPYALNPAIRDKLDDVLEQWGTAVDEVVAAIYDDFKLL